MIKCWVGLGGGGELALPTAVSWKFCYGTGTPCDSFFMRCLWKRGQERMLSCRFFAQWEGERVFTGVVDEFAVICGRDGLYLELSGRGMAALLLDNEAMPAEYQRCTRADIVAGHVAPYGLEAAGGEGLPAVSGAGAVPRGGLHRGQRGERVERGAAVRLLLRRGDAQV